MPSRELVIGIDIGGTNTSVGIVDREARISYRIELPTEAEKPAEMLFERIFKKLQGRLQKLSAESKIVGIGIGAPNGNYYTGGIENPPNLKWGNVNLVKLAKKYIDLPVAVTNDANAAALGEMLFGAARGMKDFIEVTLGTGVGSGIVVNGELVYGHDGFAGEMGHVIVRRNGRLCGCGRRGCLETYASAPGLRRTVFEKLSQTNEESVLRDIPFNDLTSKMVYDAALEGDRVAMASFEFTGKVLGETLADAVAYFSPEAIVLFGGLAAAGDFIFIPTKQHMEHNLLPIYRNKVKIIPSGLPEGDAAILGSAALIWNELKKD
ncbi:MAG: ROK family protein [Calditrichaeota bacterium]|nr:ROK family protein [Calditrichota bacterium]